MLSGRDDDYCVIHTFICQLEAQNGSIYLLNYIRALIRCLEMIMADDAFVE